MKFRVEKLYKSLLFSFLSSFFFSSNIFRLLFHSSRLYSYYLVFQLLTRISLHIVPRNINWHHEPFSRAFLYFNHHLESRFSLLHQHFGAFLFSRTRSSLFFARKRALCRSFIFLNLNCWHLTICSFEFIIFYASICGIIILKRSDFSILLVSFSNYGILLRRIYYWHSLLLLQNFNAYIECFTIN